MRHPEKLTRAFLFILSLNTRTGSHQKGSKRKERGDTSHSTWLNAATHCSRMLRVLKFYKGLKSNWEIHVRQIHRGLFHKELLPLAQICYASNVFLKASLHVFPVLHFLDHPLFAHCWRRDTGIDEYLAPMTIVINQKGDQGLSVAFTFSHLSSIKAVLQSCFSVWYIRADIMDAP